MMKYVYKDGNGLAFLQTTVKSLELASIADLNKEIEKAIVRVKKSDDIYKKYAKKTGYKHNSPNLTHAALLDIGTNLSDELILKEDTYYWDTDENKYLSIENYQSFDNLFSWTIDEKTAFHEILLNWIVTNDHTYSLYDYLADIRTNTEFGQATEHALKFERLFHKYIGSEDRLGHMEHHYQLERKRYAQYEETCDHVEGGTN